MKILDLTLPSPAENLACEEALLDMAETAHGGQVLRFWESHSYFVVVGYANKVATEVHRAACDARRVPILRRCSGGGTVLQGPGCLNYALILKIADGGPLSTITSANKIIMERNRSAMETLLQRPVHVSGHTDLSVDGLKFSGNSQRRRKHHLLFHGTILLNFKLGLVSELLAMPSKQPDYRADRSHGEFIVNIGMDAESVKAALCRAWRATSPLTVLPQSQIQRLVAERYDRDDWNFKF
ncbi:MAG TPA: lipoate--protein ligase family protein [Verrucomicrobiota bacterium]|nr:lipoate--protein ligase family protein [Verrucomicrobiota bacterium]